MTKRITLYIRIDVDISATLDDAIDIVEEALAAHSVEVLVPESELDNA
jgi:hypothetical protein